MNTLITGAKGFLGKHVARQLSVRNEKVIGIGHGTWSNFEYQQYGIHDWVNGAVNFNNIENIAKIYGEINTIVHLAGGSSVGPSFSDPAEDYKKTVSSTSEVLEWIRVSSPKTKIIYISSAAVYGNKHTEKIHESSIQHPYSPYGYHKRMSEMMIEMYAETYCIGATIIRMFSIYGPELRKQLLWDLCCKIYKSQQHEIILGGTGSEVRDWIYATDAANLICHMTSREDNTPLVINGGTGKGTSVSEISSILANKIGLNNKKVVFSGASRAGDPKYLVANTDNLSKTNFKSRISIEDGINEYVKWFKKEIKIDPNCF